MAVPGSESSLADDLIERLLALPNVDAQKRLLEEQAALLDDEVAAALKAQANRFLRVDMQRSLGMAALLLYQSELTGNPLYRALGLLAEAHARSFGGLGEYEAAVVLFDEAARIFWTLDRPVDAARTQIGRIWSLAQLGRYDESLEAGEQASRILEEKGEWLLLAKLTVNLGIIHRRLRDDAAALALYDRARDLYARLGSQEAAQKALARLEVNRSNVLRNLGRFENSVQASHTALEMLIQTGQQASAARARQSLAATYFILGRYNEALELLNQAIDFFLDDGRERDAILAQLFTSDCLLHLGRFTDVLEKCKEVRRRFTEFGARLEVAQAILNEAAAYAGLHRYVEALASLEEARLLFEEEGNDAWVACSELERASVLHHEGRFEESLAVAQGCVKVLVDHEMPVEEARAHLIAARAALALERHDQSRRLVTKALDVGVGHDIPALTHPCRHILGAVARAEGDLQKALAEYDQAIEELERLRGRLMIEYRADFLEDKQIVYQDAVDVCLALNQPLRGLGYAERAKSRALVDLLAFRLDMGIRVRETADQPLVEELMQLRSERDQLYRRWESDEELIGRGWTSPGGAQQQVQQDVLVLEKRITELWHKLLIRNADYARDASLWQVRTEPVQPYLAPDTVLVEFFAVHQELVVFLVTAGAVQARRLALDLEGVQRLVRLLWLNLGAVPKSGSSGGSALAANAQGLLRQIYDRLLAPLSDELAPYRQLIVVPHGPLHYLPFHALHDGHSYLLERYEISYLPGASVLRYCCEAQPETSGLVAFGHSFGAQLPYTVQEADAIADLWGGSVYLEEAATPARLREAAPKHRILHLAAHGDFRPDNPLFSGLALDGGWLTTLDIFNLQLHASLVTLSACQTGRNVVGGGDELLGLMRAFLYAGAASLVLSLWAVEDRSTARLMEAFYQKLAEGCSKGMALRHAQLQFIQAGYSNGDAPAGPYTHPYFWAPFFLVGHSGSL
ncbi:MAG: CHAT domain-containing protein [Anaerolineae bacterium]